MVLPHFVLFKVITFSQWRALLSTPTLIVNIPKKKKKKGFYKIISAAADSLFQIDSGGENWRLDLQFLYTMKCGIDSIFSIS